MIGLTEHIDEVSFIRPDGGPRDGLWCGHCEIVFYEAPNLVLGLMEANNAAVAHASGGVAIYDGNSDSS